MTKLFFTIYNPSDVAMAVHEYDSLESAWHDWKENVLTYITDAVCPVSVDDFVILVNHAYKCDSGSVFGGTWYIRDGDNL